MGLIESKGEDIVPLTELVKQDLLGHGAMCQVFQAHWTPKNVSVALKQMMVPDVVPEDLADFRRELQLTRTMKHPNLVYLYGGCAEPPNLYLVMELVAHGAASDLLRTKTTDLPWPLRFRMALDTALGMRFLHSQKVMHRDLKTENLLVNSLQVDAETVIKISDLGISRFSEGNDALMTIGRGTTKWMAPEVLEGSNTYSFPVDVYSFGIILWEFYAQAAPYTEVRSVLRLPQMIIDGYRPPVPHSCPPVYAKLMQDCWQGDPTKRPSFEEVTRRLFEMKDEVCPNLALPASVVAIFEKGEKSSAALASPKRPKTDASSSATSTASPASKKGPSGEVAASEKGKDKDKAKKKEKEKEKRKTKLKTKEKEKEDKKEKTSVAATASTPTFSPISPRPTTTADASASVGSMVRRWEGGASAPAPSAPTAAARAPSRPPTVPRPVQPPTSTTPASRPPVGAGAGARGVSSPAITRPTRAVTASSIPEPSSGSAIDDSKKKGGFFTAGMFGGKKKIESTRN